MKRRLRLLIKLATSLKKPTEDASELAGVTKSRLK